MGYIGFEIGKEKHEWEEGGCTLAKTRRQYFNTRKFYTLPVALMNL